MGNRMGKRAKKMSASSPNLEAPNNGNVSEDRTKRPLPKLYLTDPTPSRSPPASPHVARTPSNLSTPSSDQPPTTPNIAQSRVSPSPSNPELATKSMPLKTVVVAVYTYESRQNDELSFKRSDRMEVVAESENCDWWMVKHLRTGAIGYIPRNYVTLASNPVRVEDWWCPLDRGDAERTLLNPDLGRGTFLIRERPDHFYPYALSIKDYSDSKQDYAVKHYKIRTANNGRCYITNTRVFRSIAELVAFYSENQDSGLCCLLTTPCPKKDPFVPFREMEISRNQITLLRKLGDGYFGEVWKGVMAGHGEVAIKMMKVGKMSTQSFIKEAKVLHNLRHPKLVPLRGVCRKSQPMMIVTELMAKGDLLKYLQGDIGRRLKLAHLVDMASQIASGMSYLEKCNYIHRDLRAANVLVGENNIVKIADFGLARLVLNEDDIYIMTNQSKVPIKWTAPEALFKREFSTKSDVWSFGVLLYEIFSYGKTPYPGISTAGLQRLLQTGYRMQRPKNFPRQVYDIMLQCWNELPEDRPEFAYLHSAFDDYIICTENCYRERES